MEQKQTVGQATASLVLGILSLILTGILTAIPAVICGHIAKSKIKKDPEHLQGDGLALAGLITGYVTIAFSILIIPLMLAIAIPSFHKARESAFEKACSNNMRIMDSAKEQYAMEHDQKDGMIVEGVELEAYLNASVDELICPQGGEITPNPIGIKPECTLHGTCE